MGVTSPFCCSEVLILPCPSTFGSSQISLSFRITQFTIQHTVLKALAVCRFHTSLCHILSLHKSLLVLRHLNPSALTQAPTCPVRFFSGAPTSVTDVPIVFWYLQAKCRVSDLAAAFQVLYNSLNTLVKVIGLMASLSELKQTNRLLKLKSAVIYV